MILHNVLKSINLNGGHHYTSNDSQSLSGIGERTAEEFYSNNYSTTFTIGAHYPDRQRSCGGNQCPNSTPLPQSDAFVHQGHLVLPDVQYHSSEKRPVAIVFLTKCRPIHAYCLLMLGSNPISPSKAATGVYFQTPKKIALTCCARRCCRSMIFIPKY